MFHGTLPWESIIPLHSTIKAPLRLSNKGCRSQDNLDNGDREARRKLPWRERYDWRLIAVVVLIALVFAAGLMVSR